MPIEIPNLAGKPYRPSNGTEGELFMEMHCYRCVHNGPCMIPTFAMSFESGHSQYPKEWVFDAYGWPTCTAFEKHIDEGK